MAYIKDEYHFPDSIEIEYKWEGKYGAKGEKRAPKEKITPEVIAKQNQWKKETECRRVIKLNFKKNDYYVTLTYPKDTRKSIEDVKADVSNLNERLRYRYKKMGAPFKWVHRIEIGSQGGIHCHMLVNRVDGLEADALIQELWHKRTGGRTFNERYQADEQSAHKLADYFVKPLTTQQSNKLEAMGGNPKELVSYSTSRNLKRPVKVRKKYSHWTMKKVVESGQPKARPGYFVDKSTIYFGVNKFTGLSYLYYTEVKGGDDG